MDQSDPLKILWHLCMFVIGFGVLWGVFGGSITTFLEKLDLKHHRRR
jgi:hypothetical protein